MAGKTIVASVQFNGITQASNSIKTLREELAKLKKEQSQADPTSERFQELSDLIAEVSGNLSELKNRQDDLNRSFEESKQAAGSYNGLVSETANLVDELKGLSVGVNATQEQFDALLRKIKENNASIKQFNDQLRRPNDESIKVTALAVKDLETQVQSLIITQSELDETSIEYANINAEIADATVSLRELTSEQNQFGTDSSIEEIAQNYKELALQTRQLTEQLAQISSGSFGAEEAINDLKNQIIANNKELAQMQSLLADVGNKRAAINQYGQVEILGRDYKGIPKTAGQIKEALALIRKEQENVPIYSKEWKLFGEAIARYEAELDQARKTQDKFNDSADGAGKTGSIKALIDDTKKLTDRLKNAVVGVNITQEQFDALKERIKENNAEIANFNRELRNSKPIAERVQEGVVGAFKEIALQIVAGASALEGFNALQSIGELGLGLERGFAQVNTVAQLSREELEALKAQVLDTARSSTADLEQVPEALFNIVSATGDVQKSQEILGTSLKAAQAGFSDLNDAAEAGTNVFNAVQAQTQDINEVFDVLFRTQKEGVLTFADLSKEFPKVSASATQAGISYKEAASALATLTKAGFSANASATILDATFRDVTDPTKQKGFKELGASLFDASGNARPLIDVIKDLSSTLDGLPLEQREKEIKKLGLSAESAKGIGILTTNLEVFGQVSDSIVKGSVGELQRQLDSSSNSADDLKAASNDLKVTLLEQLGPAFNVIVKGAISLTNAAAKLVAFLFENKGVVLLLASAYALLNAAKIQSIANTVKEGIVTAAKTALDKATAVATAVKTAAQTAYSVATQLLTGQLTLAAAAQRLLNLAMASNPAGLVVAGVTALAGVLLIYANRSKEVTEAEKRRLEIAKAAQEAAFASNEAIAKETAGLEMLVRGIKDENTTKEEKLKLTNDLISQYGQYLDDLDKEALKAGEVEKAYQKIKAAIIDSIVARQKSQAIEKLFSEQIERQRDAANRLALAFNTTADDVLRMVDEFKNLSPEIQDAVNSGQGLAGIGKAAADGLTPFQVQTVKFFAEVEKNAVRTGKVVGDQLQISQREYQRLIDSGADKQKIGADILLNTIQDTNNAINQGLEDIDRQFGALGAAGGGTFTTLSGGANGASESVEQLQERIKNLKEEQQQSTDAKGWQALQKEIDKVQRQIEAITGASKETQAANKRSQKAIEKTEKDEAEALKKRQETILALTQQLDTLLIENTEDATQKLLDAEEDRYQKEQDKARENYDKILTDTEISEGKKAGLATVYNRILEQLEAEHATKLADITSEAHRKELEQQQKDDQAIIDNRRKVLDLKLDTVETELQTEERNYKKRRELILLERDLRLESLDIESDIAYKEATTAAERTAVLKNEEAKRKAIIKKAQQDLADEGKNRGGILARLFGLSDEEAQAFSQAFQQATALASQAIDQFFQARLAALDKLIETQQEKIDRLAESTQRQVDKVTALEERLKTASGNRRQYLIGLIEQERKREAELFKEKVKQEKVKADLEERKRKIERQQGNIKKAQGVAEATINTAVAITKALSIPPPAGPILAGIYGALGAAQIALISAQKFAKGGKLVGPSHDEGGIPIAVPSQNRLVEAEGGEWIIKKSASSNNDAILRRINEEGDRTRFALVETGRRYLNGGQVGYSAPNFEAINAATAAQLSVNAQQFDTMIGLLQGILDTRPEIAYTEFKTWQRRNAQIDQSVRL